ncbi:lipopolysaccharide biosynthesis protein [Butyrivibrio sp. MC2013]|uniref:lipopolysaccharide biosynthesis protein n=1 Tax=Butyrivibrio sp. MC2013 TaxID=1280686 RepID=UPI000417E849|nr:oligosaccharide flippase family protein [Butyrivibrio sp. MC2013]
MAVKSRTVNSARNASISFIGAIFGMLLQFICRGVFVRMLSNEYLGLNGLFSDILNMLSLSELGIGTAMSYAMYKPIADRNTEEIKSLMHLYKKMYTTIGTVIIVVGCSITPFLQVFIKEMPDIPLIRLYYVMYVLNSGVSYFLVYKKTLITCNQEEYIPTIVSSIFSVLSRLFQVVVLLISRSFLLYLSVQILFSLGENVLNSYIADNKYPYIKEKDITPLAKVKYDEIKKNIKAMLMHKIGSVIVSGTDSIIISKLIGLVALGSFSNYNLIITTASSLINRVFTSFTASFGNLVASADRKRSLEVFDGMIFFSFWIYTFIATGFVCLIQPFIAVWLGKHYLLDVSTVYVFAAYFFLGGMRNPALIMRNATGTFYNDRYKALLEAFVNLVVSIPLTIKFGIMGVKLGTIVSMLSVAIWIEGFVLYKYYFNANVFGYYFKLFKYYIVALVICALSVRLTSLITGAGFAVMILKGIICTVTVNGVIIAVFCRTKEFRMITEKIIKIVSKS